MGHLHIVFPPFIYCRCKACAQGNAVFVSGKFFDKTSGYGFFAWAEYAG